MADAGFVYTDDPTAAGVIIINTCAFIEPAVDESIDTILDYREHRDAFLVVAGCMPLRYQESLREPLPEVDLFLTPDKIADLPRIFLKAALHRAEETGVSPVSKRTAPRSHPRKASSMQPGRILTTAGTLT